MVATVSTVGSSHRREGGDWDTQLSREETKLGLESERPSEAPRKGSGSNLELQAPAPLLSGWESSTLTPGSAQQEIASVKLS